MKVIRGKASAPTNLSPREKELIEDRKTKKKAVNPESDVAPAAPTENEPSPAEPSGEKSPHKSNCSP